MAGENDSLSDFGCTTEHLNNVPGLKTLVVYAGGDHGLEGSRALGVDELFFAKPPIGLS